MILVSISFVALAFGAGTTTPIIGRWIGEGSEFEFRVDGTAIVGGSTRSWKSTGKTSIEIFSSNDESSEDQFDSPVESSETFEVVADTAVSADDTAAAPSDYYEPQEESRISFRYAISGSLMTLSTDDGVMIRVVRVKDDLTGEQLADIVQGEWDLLGSKNEVHVFEDDSMYIYQNGEWKETDVIQFETNSVSKSNYLVDDYYETGALSIAVSGDTLHIQDGTVLVKRKKPIVRKPYFTEITNSLPEITIHRVVPVIDVLAQLFPQVPVSKLQRSIGEKTINLSPEIFQKGFSNRIILLDGGDGYSGSLSFSVVEKEPVIPTAQIDRIRIQKTQESPRVIAVTVVPSHEVVLDDQRSAYESDNESYALFLNGAFYSYVKESSSENQSSSFAFKFISPTMKNLASGSAALKAWKGILSEK